MIIIFLYIIFLIILIFYGKKYFEYFKSLDLIDKIIFICTVIVEITIILILYFTYCFCYNIFFFPSEINEKSQFDSKTSIENSLHIFSVYLLEFLIYFILLPILFILFHIFVFWMIIIIFVPYIIIVPIPIIPFILPIPLKTMMLELIPPFRKLTDRGILPLMRRIFFRLISYETIKNKFTNSFVDIYGFLFDDIKIVLNDVIKLYKPKDNKISKDIQDDQYKIGTIDDNTDNKKQSEEAIENENTRLKEIIKNEYNICVKTKKKFTNYGESTLSNVYEDTKNDFNCNFDELKRYLKNKF